MSIIHFIIPGKPFAWRRAQRDKRSGRTFTDKEMVAHQVEVARIGGEAWGPKPPLFGPVKLLVIGTFETPPSWPPALREAAARGEVYHDIKPDDDNILKQVADALQFVVFVDDCQKADTRVVLRYGQGERTECWVQGLAGPETPAARARARKWRAGGYDAAIAKAACGPARWPRVLDAIAREGRRG